MTQRSQISECFVHSSTAHPERTRQNRLSRREFLRQGSLLAAGAALAGHGECAADQPPAKSRIERQKAVIDALWPKAKIGLVTDLHYADRDTAGGRRYRETPAKLAEAIRTFREEVVDCVVALGDLIDSADTLDAEKGYLRRIVKEFAAIPAPKHFALGNHCVSALTKSEYLEITGQKATFYSFDVNGIHCVALDACFRADGQPYGRKNFSWTDANVPAAELEWLQADLRRTPHKAVVFVHQRLDVKPPLGIANAPAVRKILEDSGKVLAVVEGHDHKGDFTTVGRIPYYTLAAMVEGNGPGNNAYAVLEVLSDGTIQIRGFGRQKSYYP